MVGARLASALLHFGTEAHRYDCRSEKVDMSQEPRYNAMTSTEEIVIMSQAATDIERQIDA